MSALLDFGKSIAGDVIGGAAALWEGKKNRSLAKDQFRTQLDESVQRRVADAKKAGIHPLFALGASVGSSPTAAAGDLGIAAAGDAIGGGIKDYMRWAESKKAAAAQEQLLSAQLHQVNAAAGRDAAEAALLDSQRARIEQEMASQGRDGISNVTVPYALGQTGETITYGPAIPENPRVPVSKSLGVKAGLSPAQQDFVFPDGRKITLDSDEMQMDEVRQIDRLYQRAVHKGSDAFMWLHEQLKKRGLPYKWMYGGK